MIQPWLEQNPNPTDEEIRLAICGNLCRCIWLSAYRECCEAGCGEDEGVTAVLDNGYWIFGISFAFRLTLMQE